MNPHLGLSDYYLECARGYIPGAIPVHKFGLAEGIDVGDGECVIWGGTANDIDTKIPEYNWADGAVIGQLSSTVDTDTQVISVQGLDENWELTVQEVTLTGQTPVLLSTPLRRVFRGYNADSTEFAGYVYASATGANTTLGVPDLTTEVYFIIHPCCQQTQMALYTVPAEYSLYLTHGWAHISKQIATEAVVKIYRRAEGGVFRVLHTLALQTSGSSGDQRPYVVPLKLPEKTDIVYKAISYANDTAISAGFHGVLLKDESRN